jgi:cytidylate kinase
MNMGFINDSYLFYKATPVDTFPGNSKIIIAIDGHSGCGKSTTARQVAAQLGYTYIDSGAMYRAVALYFIQHKIDFASEKAVREALAKIHITFEDNPETGRVQTHLNGRNVEEEIRKLPVANAVPEVSAIPDVRKAMVGLQQKLGQNRGVVMDGRDIGTQVFPDAELKVFMTADPLVRAERRRIELQAKGEQVELAEIVQNLEKRDHLDTTRTESPLRKASDAQLLDTSHLSIARQVEWVVQQAYLAITTLLYWKHSTATKE